MPIRIPPGLYGGGAFKIDSTAATDYYLKQKAKEDAKAEALDKYFMGLTDKVNPAGMRDQESKAFNKALANYQDFAITNRKELARGNTQLAAEARKLANIPFQIAQDSKAISAATKQVGSMIGSNPENRQRLTAETLGFDEDGKPTINPLTGGPTGLVANEEPKWIINPDGSVGINPRHSTIDITSIAYNPKTMSAKEIEDSLTETASGIDYDDTEIIKKQDPSSKFGVIETTIKKYKPETLKKFGDRAALKYSDPTIKYNWDKVHPFDKWVKDDQNKKEFESLNEQFQKVYGKPIENSKELYQAAAILKNNTTKAESKGGVDLDKQWEYRNAKEHRQKIERANMNRMPTQQVNEGNAFDDLPNADLLTGITIKDRVILGRDGKPYNSPSGTQDVHLDYKHIPATVVASLKASGFDPDYLLKGVNVEVRNGKIENMSNKYIPSVSRTGMKVFQLNYNKEPQKGRQPVFSAPFD